MSKKSNGEGKEQTAEELKLILTDDQKKMILNIVYHMQKLKMEQEALKEDIDATAQNLGLKKALVSKLAKMVMSEQTSGGVVNSERNILDLVEQVLEAKDDYTPPNKI